MTYTLHHGDCLDVLKTLPANSVDAIVTDPPYELGFMGKAWDASGIAYNVEVWRECLRVLKHGGHLLAFGGSRTYHRLACAVEDAGFEIRDQIQWIYAQGFPKSLDISKAIDKAAGAEREVVNSVFRGNRAGVSAGIKGNVVPRTDIITAPATPAAVQWDGWGTALKPAHEPIVVARKPLSEKTVAANVLKWGTGGLNIDGGRVEGAPPSVPQPIFNSPTGRIYGMKTGKGRNGEMSQAQGRFPANVIHDGSDEVLALFPMTGGGGKPVYNKANKKSKNAHAGYVRKNSSMFTDDQEGGLRSFGDSGSAARFFYCAKASKADRDEGNHHPTVKPTALMRYLCRLVTPPAGVVLDPFAGSGSTGKGAVLEGFNFIGIEKDAEYFAIAKKRIESASNG